MDRIKQVYQYGPDWRDSFGTQKFEVVINGKHKHYEFCEGDHVDIDSFVNALRLETNGGSL